MRFTAAARIYDSGVSTQALATSASSSARPCSGICIFPSGFYRIFDYNGSGLIGYARSKVGVFRGAFLWVASANGTNGFDGVGEGPDLAVPFGGLTKDKPVAAR